MIRKIVLCFLSVALVFTLSGCNYIGESISSMLKPPGFSEQQADIYKALETSVKEDGEITLISPENGDYRSAVIMHNTDNEQAEEAIVFYKSKTESGSGEGEIRVCLLDRVEGDWKVVWNIPGEGAKVDKVLFLNNAQMKDEYIIIGFIPENQGQNTYCIYNYKNRTLCKVKSGSYQMMELYDITQNGQEDFITVGYEDEEVTGVSQNLSSLKTTASIYELEGGSFVKTDQADMSGKAVQYENTKKDDATFGKPALILDEQINKNTYATEILTCENGRLKNLMTDGQTDLFEQTFRVQIPISYDIDGDGKIEIPKVTLFSGYTQNSNSPVYMSVWRKIDGGSMSSGIPAYVNYSQGYGLILPESWVGRVSAKSVVQNNEIEFFKYNGSVDDDKDKILDLKIETLGNKKNFPAGYTIIDTVGQLVFMAKSYDIKDSELNFPVDAVKDNLIKMYVTSN